MLSNIVTCTTGTNLVAAQQACNALASSPVLTMALAAAMAALVATLLHRAV